VVEKMFVDVESLDLVDGGGDNFTLGGRMAG
jgi:hypothetical protein